MAPSKKLADDASRQRVNMACAYCRYRKIKCCGSVRCTNCIRTKRECVYIPVPDSSKADKAARKEANLERKRIALALTERGSGGSNPSSAASTPPTAQGSSPSSTGPIDMRTGLPVTDLSYEVVGMKRKKSISLKFRASAQGGEFGSDDEQEGEEAEDDSGSDVESSTTARSERRRTSIATLPLANVDFGRGRHETLSTSSVASYSSDPQPLTPNDPQIDWTRRLSPLACEEQPRQILLQERFSPDSDATSLPSPAEPDLRPLSPDYLPYGSPTSLTPYFPSVALGTAHQPYSPDTPTVRLEQQPRVKTIVPREKEQQYIDPNPRFNPSVETMRRPGLPRTTSDPSINPRTSSSYQHYSPSPIPFQQDRPYYAQSPAPHPNHFSRSPSSSSSFGLGPPSNTVPRRISMSGTSQRYSSPHQPQFYSPQQRASPQLPAHAFPPSMGHRHSVSSTGHAYSSYNDQTRPAYSSSLPYASQFYGQIPEHHRATSLAIPRSISHSHFTNPPARQQQQPYYPIDYASQPAAPSVPTYHYDDAPYPCANTVELSRHVQQQSAQASPNPSTSTSTSTSTPTPTNSSSLLTAPTLYASGIALSPYDLSVSAELNALFSELDSEQLALEAQGGSLLLDHGQEHHQQEGSGQFQGGAGVLGLVDNFDSEFAAEVEDWQDRYTSFTA